MKSKSIIIRLTPGKHEEFLGTVKRKRTSMQKVIERLISNYIKVNEELENRVNEE